MATLGMAVGVAAASGMAEEGVSAAVGSAGVADAVGVVGDG